MEPAYLRLPFLVAPLAEWLISGMVQPVRLLPQQGQVGQGQAVSLPEQLREALTQQPAVWPAAAWGAVWQEQQRGTRFLL